MPETLGVLVDTSVWVHFFRLAQSQEAGHLDGLLQARGVVTCAPIRAEVISGARTQKEWAQLREVFRAIPCLDLAGDLWDRIEHVRFALARKGIQATLVDLMIALVAQRHEVPLWTLDEDFSDIRSAVAFFQYVPEV